MSTAKLNVWITAFGDACHIEDKDQWFVHVTDCEGKPLVYCGKKYVFLPAKCGHLEIEIPPGCYTVFAGHSPQPSPIHPWGNRLTHVQVVRANCGDHVCVTLFSPTMWFCGTWFAEAVKSQYAGLEKANVDPKLAKAAVTAVEALVAKLPPDPYAANTLRLAQEGTVK